MANCSQFLRDLLASKGRKLNDLLYIPQIIFTIVLRYDEEVFIVRTVIESGFSFKSFNDSGSHAILILSLSTSLYGY